MGGDADIDSSASDSNEHSYQALIRKYNRNQREIRRLRSTVSFQLGLHLTTAVRQPWRLLTLPDFLSFAVHETWSSATW